MNVLCEKKNHNIKMPTRFYKKKILFLLSRKCTFRRYFTYK